MFKKFVGFKILLYLCTAFEIFTYKNIKVVRRKHISKSFKSTPYDLFFLIKSVMNELLNVQIENNQDYGLVVSSRVVAQGLGKQHKHVLESIDNLAITSTAESSALFIISNYIASNGKENREYLLTKKGFTLYMFNIQGYNDFKLAYINKFEEMEKELNVRRLPQNYAQALRELADSWEREQILIEENRTKDVVIAEMKPKVSYYDLILSSTDCLTVTQIAKDYGMSAKKLNQILFDLNIQFKQSGQWLLYQKFAEEGYTKSETVAFERPNGTTGTALHTKWTQKGRLFLYELLKRSNILPLIEQEL